MTSETTLKRASSAGRALRRAREGDDPPSDTRVTQAAVELQAMRVTRSGGGSYRTKSHDPEAPLKGAKRCTCVDCRIARGHYPAHLSD